MPGEKMRRALDLFCKAGGATKGLQRAGFHVTGVDIEPQPNYCGDEFIQTDCKWLCVGKLMEFDFVWASPPCQAFSNAQRIRGNAHPDLIAETRAKLEQINPRTQWCIENVEGAPLINPITLCGTMFGLKTYRHRLFECSFPIEAPRHGPHWARNTKMGRRVAEGEYMHIVGNFSGVKVAREVMGIDWMTRDELAQAIPPAYAEYIGNTAISKATQS